MQMYQVAHNKCKRKERMFIFIHWQRLYDDQNDDVVSKIFVFGIFVCI